MRLSHASLSSKITAVESARLPDVMPAGDASGVQGSSHNVVVLPSRPSLSLFNFTLHCHPMLPNTPVFLGSLLLGHMSIYLRLAHASTHQGTFSSWIHEQVSIRLCLLHAAHKRRVRHRQCLHTTVSLTECQQ